MEAFYITLALNVLLALFLLIGFFCGLGRGIKKSALRLAFFAGSCVVAGLLCGLVTNWALSINVWDSSVSSYVTIREYIINTIVSQPEIADLYASSTALQEFIAQVPAMLLNVFSFVILVYVVGFIGWIAYAITAKIVIKKHKKPFSRFGESVYTVKEGQPAVLEEIREKKHRFLGGLVGAAQGLILLFLTLIPLSGIVSTFNTLANQTVQAQVETNIVYADNQNEYTQLSRFIRENVPAEILEYFDAYSSSITFQLFGFGGLDLAVFDAFSTVQVGSERVSLRKEVNVVADICDDVLYFANLDYDNLNFDEIDFDRIDNAINALFDSGMFRSVGIEILNYYLGQVIEEGEFQGNEFGEEIMSMLETLEASVDGANPDDLRQDVLALVGIARVCIESGLVELFISGDEIDINEIIALISENNYKVISDILDELFTSTTLKSLLVQGFNLALGEAENQLAIITEEQVELDRVSVDSINWTHFKADIFGIITNSLEVFNIVKDYDETTPPQTYDFESILSRAGTILNIIQNFTVLTDTVGGNNIYEQVLTEFDKTEYAEFVDFSSLASIDWVNELNLVVDLYLFFEPLMTQTDITFAILNYTGLGEILNSLFNSQLVQSVKIEVFDLLLQDLDEDAFEVFNDMYLHFNNDKDYIYELGDEILNYYNVFALFGQSGLLDAIMDNSFSDSEFSLTNIIQFFETVAGGQTDTRMDKLIGYLLDCDSFRIFLTKFISEYLNSEFEELDGQLWQDEKTVDWTGWTAFETDLREIMVNVLAILKNVDISELNEIDFSDMNEYEDVLFDLFNSSVNNIGAIFDILAMSNFLTYEDSTDVISIYDQLLLNNFNLNLVYIENALSENYVPGYWASELPKFFNIINISQSTIIDEEEGTTLWDALISDADWEDIFTNNTINLNSLISAMLDSDLLKVVSVELINAFNLNIMLLIDDTYSGEVATTDLDIASDKDNIFAVITSALKLASLESIDAVIDDYENQKINLIDFLNALQADYNAGGVFSSAYSDIANYLNDSEGSDISQAIAYAIDEGNFGTGINDYDWSAILEAVEDYLV